MKNSILIFLLLFSLSSFAQTWENLTCKDWVFSIDENNEFMLFGTSGGLVKLNKETKEMITFDRANKRIPDNSVFVTFPVKNDSIWLGSRHSGIGILNNDACITYNSENSNLPHDQYNSSIAIDATKNIYIGSLGYVSKFKNGSFEIIKEMDPLVPFDCIYDMKIDINQNVWIASHQGLFKYNGNNTQKITDVAGNIFSIAFDKSNHIWVGSNLGLYYYNGISWFCYNTGNSRLPSSDILKLCFDTNDNLWIGTYNNLVCYSSSGIWSTYICTNQTGKNFNISTIYIDTNNTLWIGTRNNGLLIFKNGIFESFNYSQPSIFPSNSIQDIAYANGKLWFGVWNYGLYSFDGHQFQSWDTLNSNLSLQNVILITPDNLGNLWLRTNKLELTSEGVINDYKLTKFDGNQFTDIVTPFPMCNCNVIKVNTKGIFWFGTGDGIYKWEGTNWEHYNIDNSPLSSNDINQIDFDSKGNIWIGQNGSWDDAGHLIGGGLMKYDGENSWQEYTVFNSPLPYSTIKALKVDKNDVIWLGTVNDGAYDGGGLTKFDGVNWQSFTKENSGISDNQVLSINEDSEGVIWSGTLFGGLVSYNKSDKWETFMQSNSGIASNQVGKVIIDNNDKIWMNHNVYSGVSTYDRKALGVDFKEMNNTGNIKIYPNPASEYLIVESIDSDDVLSTIKIYDIQGKILYHKSGLNSNSFLCSSNEVFGKITSSILLIEVTTSKNKIQRKVILINK